MKNFTNIFSPKSAFKLTIMVLSVLSIIILAFLSSTGFAFLSTTTTNPFQSGLGQKQQQEQFKDTIAVVASATKQSGILQNIFFSSDQNVSDDVKDDSSRAALQQSFNPYNIGIEANNTNNWITVNHDIYGTRNSNQTIINKENVATLQVKWRLINDVEIQDPPIIIGNKGYVQDHAGTDYSI